MISCTFALFRRVAKYATKAAECVGTLDRPLVCRRCRGTNLLLMRACSECHGSGLRTPLAALPIPEHAKKLVTTAWLLGGLPEYQDLRLRAWAHQCGYGGHFSTKSRAYSVTMGQLRNARAVFRAEHSRHKPLPDDLVISREWQFAGSGLSNAEAEVASWVRDDIEEKRRWMREEWPSIRAEIEAERAEIRLMADWPDDDW